MTASPNNNSNLPLNHTRISLDTICPGSVVRVTEVDRSRPSLCRRLTQLGIVPGTEIKIVRIAPLGCPVQIELRGFCLALRLVEASAVFVSISNS